MSRWGTTKKSSPAKAGKGMRAPLLIVAAVLASALPVLGAELEVRMETVPNGATVEQAGRTLGRTPLTLTYPAGYFQPRATVWGAYLGAPLEFTFTLAGYQPKVVKLGRGPFPWRNLYGVIVYEQYLLDRSYRIELLPEKAEAAPPPVDQVSQLERLAALRSQGVLTEEEFQVAKARVLAALPAASGNAAPITTKPRNRLDDQDIAAFCWRLIANAFPGAETATPGTTKPTREVSTAADGSDRQVVISCSWVLPIPRPAALKVSVVCGDTPATPESLCSASSQAPKEENPVCLWGTEAEARAVAQSGCLMAGSLEVDKHRSNPPGFEHIGTVDVREVLRSMAGRI